MNAITLTIAISVLLSVPLSVARAQTDDRGSIPLQFSYQEEILQDIRQVGFGLHLVYYSPGFDALQPLYGPATTHYPAVHLGITGKFRIIGGVHFRADASIGLSSIHGRLVTAELLYETRLSALLRPSIGVGYGGFAFEIGESTISKGVNQGPLIHAGMEIVNSPKTGIQLAIGYLNIPSINTEFESSNFSVRLRGILISATFINYL